MGEKVVLKAENCIDLDDLLQCPVCYEIPSGQIFQCNEGHHVCGRCKLRLDVCPVCRALFFGTRNYAMEELIASFRKTPGGKVYAGSGSSNSSTIAKDGNSVELENDIVDDNNDNNSSEEPLRPPLPCRGLFRCLCCKLGNAERLPIARLLNHLRYFHAPDLIEGRSENGEYVQAWQFSTVPGRLVTAVRVADMGIFFLIIEIKFNSIDAWLTMASSPWVAQTYNYTITLSGVDREAIFTDCVWSVRSCEGTLKKRGHSLTLGGAEARSLLSPALLGGKLSVRRTPEDQLANQTQPRAVMRVANRGTDANYRTTITPTYDFLDNDASPRSENHVRDSVGVITRPEPQVRNRNGTSTRPEVQVRERIGVLSETQVRERNAVNASNDRPATTQRSDQPGSAPATQAPVDSEQNANTVRGMSRSARRRMRQRLRAAMDEPQRVEEEIRERFLQSASTELQRIEENLRLLPIFANLNGQVVHEEENASPAGQSAGTTNSRSGRRKRRQRR